MVAVKRDVQIQIHLLLMHARVEQRARAEPLSLVNEQVEEDGFSRMANELEDELGVQTVHTKLELSSSTRSEEDEQIV